MAVIVSQIKTSITASQDEISSTALKKINIKSDDIARIGVHKTSLDARNNSDIKLVSSVWIELDDEATEKRLCDKYPFCSEVKHQKIMPDKSTAECKQQIVIAGFGPAGMFAALTLAEYGFKPVVIERGASVDERVEAVNNFWKNANLDPCTNVQFGEGGAGTFSDGKLTTRIKDPLCRYVLEKLEEFGAPEEILIKAKPHIGTDKLRNVVKNIRERIIELGGDVRFKSVLTDFKTENGKIKSVIVNDADEIPCDCLILAIGHSARDTFEMLYNKKI
ncbi:MAG: hypothetical protein IJ305_08075, partial [Oscillospiraceae bacterium]|nr:hypothetical protein [Oscillospiraceae bacterium]